MARYDSLEELKLSIACGDTPLKRISYTMLLGVRTRGPTPDLEDACRPCVEFIVRDTVSTAQALKSSPFSCEETPDRELTSSLK